MATRQFWTACFNARGNYRVLSALLEYGASVDNRNKERHTVHYLANELFPDDKLNALVKAAKTRLSR